MTNQGIVYVAQGADYLALAQQSARSLKGVDPACRIEIFTDQECKDDCFDIVRSLIAGPSPKLACLPHTSFERTLYLDCDTLVLAALGDLFDILDRFELAVAHDVRRTSQLIREKGRHSVPYAFPQMNAGVILYRRSEETQRFLQSWQDQYIELGVKRDQVSFRDLLWSSDLRFYVLPPEFNLRRMTMLDAWEPLDARPTIMHSHRLLQHLRHDDRRLTDPISVHLAERLALTEEWQREVDRDPMMSEADPISRFYLAETHETTRSDEPEGQSSGSAGPSGCVREFEKREP